MFVAPDIVSRTMFLEFQLGLCLLCLWHCRICLCCPCLSSLYLVSLPLHAAPLLMVVKVARDMTPEEPYSSPLVKKSLTKVRNRWYSAPIVVMWVRRADRTSRGPWRPKTSTLKESPETSTLKSHSRKRSQETSATQFDQ